jgi:spermidine synthase
MRPWVTLAEVRGPSGTPMVLARRDDAFVIRADGIELMSSRMHGSEDALATFCLEHAPRDARVLIGGLGMGFTVRAALDHLGPNAQIEVAELVPEIVEWNRGVLAPLAKRPLDDPRVRLFVGDVAEPIASGRYDAILLDVDNGPAALSTPTNAALYGERSLARVVSALVPGGVLGVWSAGESPRFTARLRSMGFDVRAVRLRARVTRGPRHVVWIARTAGSGARGRSRLR